tara:strand:+ start:282 stop:467 length:186 start_codon:yes stop_codon:yes gene_type:complete
MPRRIKSHHNYETNHKKQIENMTTIIEHLMKRIRYLEDNIKYLQYGLLIEDINKIIDHSTE